MLTSEQPLRIPSSVLGTTVAHLRGVRFVYDQHLDTGFVGLVFDVVQQLRKREAVNLIVRVASEVVPVSDTTEVADDDNCVSFSSVFDYRVRNLVYPIIDLSGFGVTDTFNDLLAFRTFAFPMDLRICL